MRRVFLGPEPTEVNGVEVRTEEVVVERGGTIHYGPASADRDLWKKVLIRSPEFVSPPTETEALRWIRHYEPMDLWILQPAGWSKETSDATYVVAEEELTFYATYESETGFARTVEDMNLDELRGEVDYVQ